VAEVDRHAAMDAVKGTAESLAATLEQMKAVEDMRQTLRDIKNLNGLEPN
jgi:hypothetical protein